MFRDEIGCFVRFNKGGLNSTQGWVTCEREERRVRTARGQRGCMFRQVCSVADK